MGLLDADQFEGRFREGVHKAEGRFREGVHKADVSDYRSLSERSGSSKRGHKGGLL